MNIYIYFEKLLSALVIFEDCKIHMTATPVLSFLMVVHVPTFLD